MKQERHRGTQRPETTGSTRPQSIQRNGDLLKATYLTERIGPAPLSRQRGRLFGRKLRATRHRFYCVTPASDPARAHLHLAVRIYQPIYQPALVGRCTALSGAVREEPKSGDCTPKTAMSGCAVGCCCIALDRTSKPLWGRTVAFPGGFDSHALPLCFSLPRPAPSTAVAGQLTALSRRWSMIERA